MNIFFFVSFWAVVTHEQVSLTVWRGQVVVVTYSMFHIESNLVFFFFEHLRLNLQPVVYDRFSGGKKINNKNMSRTNLLFNNNFLSFSVFFKFLFSVFSTLVYVLLPPAKRNDILMDVKFNHTFFFFCILLIACLFYQKYWIFISVFQLFINFFFSEWTGRYIHSLSVWNVYFQCHDTFELESVWLTVFGYGNVNNLWKIRMITNNRIGWKKGDLEART